MRDCQVESVGSSDNPVRSAAEEYRRAGLSLCVIPKGEKQPKTRGWPVKSAEPSDFQPGDNIGILCGFASRRLGKGGHAYPVVIDLDDKKALQLADQYLPPTGAMEGRAGKPNSHRWYWVTGVPTAAESNAPQVAEAASRAGEFAGPFKKQFRHKETKSVLIDFIGSGGQAVVPPSLHVGSGTFRTWADGHGFDKAAEVSFSVLWEAVNNLAVASGGDPIELPGQPNDGRNDRSRNPGDQLAAADGRPKTISGAGAHIAPRGVARDPG